AGGGVGGDDLELPRSPELAETRAVEGGRGRTRTDGVSDDPVRSRPPLSASDRHATLTHARDLFNAGDYWRAHEALETVWRSIIRDGDGGAARVWQGLIQAPAALLHQRRGKRHGVTLVGRAALATLAGRQRPGVAGATVAAEEPRAPAA